ncbi:MAG: dehydrogenase [Frankiales bacterium]|nr:dehydrogenase [Frankiales bacterium]
MRATVLRAPRDIVLEDVPDPRIERPTDAVVRVAAACICGSDLWPYRGIAERGGPERIGHEFIGVVEEVGADVRTLKAGDFVISPFSISDGTCANCHNGVQTSCLNGGWWGSTDSAGGSADAGQGEALRVPLADGTLVALPELPDEAQLPGLLALSDVMGTGHHAALTAGVTAGSTVVVVGDGAVGLCAVIAARRLGAEQIVAMSRHASRQHLAGAFGATDIVAERGDEGVARVKELFGGIGPDAVLECVGTKESMQQAIDSVRPGGIVGYVGVPFGAELPIQQMFSENKGVRGGVASVRSYIPELLPDVLSGAIAPGQVFDLTLPLEQVADGYRAMDQREAVKVLLRP